MQKVIDLLEKHVQWLALGLGVVWLLLMVWSYVIQPPASVEIGGTQLKAGNVDEHTVANAARPLEAEMKPKDPPAWEVDKFAERWLARMDWQGVEPVRIAGLVHSNPPLQNFDRPDVPKPPQPDGVIAQDPNKVRPQATGVPVLTAAPMPADWRFGRSTVIQPPPAPVPGQPVQPVAAFPQEADRDWITQSFKLKLSDIDAAFKKANIPPNPPQQPPIFTTAFLKVEMVREELVDGKWANPTTIQPLNNGVLRERFPDPKANVHVQQAYYNWAVQQTGDIVQPMFYQTILNKGDMWERPGEPVQPVMGPGAFNPQQFLVGPIPPHLNAEQRKLVMDARRAAAKLREQQKSQNRARPTRPGRGTAPEMEEMMEAPVDAERPKFLQVRGAPRGGPQGGQQQRPFRPTPPPGMAPEMEDAEVMESEFEQPLQPVLMGVGVPDVDYPAGPFDPAQWVALGQPVVQPGVVAPENPRKDEITVWAHDDTVKPGATYRYRARYFVKNPLFQQVAAVKNPAAAREFAIASPFSEWGPAITVPPLTNFFIAGVQPARQQVRFDVFTWKQGTNHHSTIAVHAGDVVGARTANADFTTGHVVVDVREDLKTRNPVVYLANAEGEAIVRTQRGDADSPVYKKLKELVAAQQQQAAAANGGAPAVR